MISQPKSRKSLVFLTILLLPVKIRKPVFISVKHLSVLVRCLEHPEDVTIPFHRVHSVGHHYDSACNNDHLVFLLDYIYYNVYKVGCRWFFDHVLSLIILGICLDRSFHFQWPHSLFYNLQIFLFYI